MKKFIQHLNYRHGITPFQKVNIRCGQDDCQRSFDSVQSLRTHLHRFHSKPKFHNMGIDSTENLISDNGNDSLMSDQCETNDEDISTFASKTNDVDFSQLIFDFVLRLRSRNINQSTVDYVVNGLEYLLGTQFEIIKQKLEPVIHSNWSSPVTDLLSELEESLSSFNIVRTDYRQKKYLKEKCGLIEPEEVLLGTRCEQYLDKDKISSLKYVPETLQYMSVKKTIKNVLSAFSKEFENNALSEKTGIMKDYRDGEQLKKHSLFNKEPNALQLQMYFDEFETVNPLGSKTKVHKVGGLYMTVKNLPTQINSKLVNIHPIIYCHSQDIKKYGFKTIFSRVLDDLQDLERGVTMEINGKEKVVKAALVMWSGDNLGIHQVFGLCESFQANKPCHYCYGKREDFSNYLTIDHFKLRTHETYLNDIELVKTNHV